MPRFLAIFFYLEQNLLPSRNCHFGLYCGIKIHLYQDVSPIEANVINYFNFIYLFREIKCRIKQQLSG